MNAQDILHSAVQLLGRSNTPVPSILQPIRDVGNSLGSDLSSLQSHTSQNQWKDMSTQEKLSSVLKAAALYGGQGLVQGGANSLASSLSVSPPGQLAEYTMGRPNPIVYSA